MVGTRVKRHIHAKLRDSQCETAQNFRTETALPRLSVSAVTCAPTREARARDFSPNASESALSLPIYATTKSLLKHRLPRAAAALVSRMSRITGANYGRSPIEVSTSCLRTIAADGGGRRSRLRQDPVRPMLAADPEPAFSLPFGAEQVTDRMTAAQHTSVSR